ncbi:hypothetical protein ACFL6U_07630 [Planctomycetota bacterium]
MARFVILTILVVLSTLCFAQEQSLTDKGTVSDTYQGTALSWASANFRGSNAAGTGTASINFGLVTPGGYSLDADTAYPLVLYLHGAGGRGSNISSMIQRPVPREFARESLVTPEYAAFILAPQVPSGQLWANSPWANGPYVQSAATLTNSMNLTIHLIRYLCDPNNNVDLAGVLGVDANDIDTHRLYIAGDSMGAYGAWDLVAWEPHMFAAAIAGSGSGPKNKLEEISQTPFWGIHGETDGTVPNRLPTDSDPDGAGTLGMMALLDPDFDNTVSTDIVRLDNYAESEDDPNILDTLIYTEFPSSFGHATVAMQWTTRVSGVFPWMFAHVLVPLETTVGPLESLEADGTGNILTINGRDVNDLIVGVTTFPEAPAHADPSYHPDKADNFELSNGASGDNQPYYETVFDQPVTKIFLVENNGNDSGFFQALDNDGNAVGPAVAFTAHEDYLKTEYRFFLGQQASGIQFVPTQPVYGIRIVKPENGNLGFDALSISGIPVPPKVRPMASLVIGRGGLIQSIEKYTTQDLILGTTTFPEPPAQEDPSYHADKADDFELSNGASGDGQPYMETRFADPVTTVFLIENNGNDSGYFQALDIDGQAVGPQVAFTAPDDYLKTGYRYFLEQACGIVYESAFPIYGLRIIQPDDKPLGFDALSISGLPAAP